MSPESWGKEGPKTVWKAKVGTGFTAATVAAGRVYTLGNVDKSDVTTLWCLNAANGSTEWKRDWPSKLDPVMYEGGPNSTPIVHAGRIYAVIKPALVLCLDAAKGTTLWETNLVAGLKADISPWGVAGSPLIVGEQLIINYGTAGTALDLKTGAVRWTTGARGASFNVPAVTSMQGEPVLMSLATNHLAAIRLRDGATLWEHPFGKGYFCHTSDPLVNGDSVFISSADDGGEVIRFGDGKPVSSWKSRKLGTFLATAALREDHLYGLSICDLKLSELRCVDWKTGSVLWSQGGFGETPGTPVTTADGKILILSDKGELTAGKISPEKFEFIRRDQVIGGKCWTPPTLSDGRMYVRNAAGDLVCLQVGPERAI